MTKVETAIIMAARRHPDTHRAHAVLQDIMARLSAGEDPEAIKALYAEGLAIMRGEAKA